MHDFGKIVYLDVEKTGSTYISNFLQQNLLLKERRFKKHAPASKRTWTSKVYFISVRNPLSQYISLYQYGLDGKGRMAESFAKAGMSDYYQAGSTLAFERWLALMLDPTPPVFTGDTYLRLQPSIFGLQTYRFLRLSFNLPLRHLKNLTEKQTLQAYYDKNKLQNFVVKTETLTEDLEKLVLSDVGVFFKPYEQIMSFLKKSDRVNESKPSSAFRPEKLSPDLIAYMKEKEWFVYDNFYP